MLGGGEGELKDKELQKEDGEEGEDEQKRLTTK